MRWRSVIPEENSFRIRRGFLFFPKNLNGEWRWLEFANTVERWWQVDWIEMCWADDPERQQFEARYAPRQWSRP